MHPKLPSKPFALFLFGGLLFAHATFPVHAEPAAVELCSPKADDHFEVTKPLLFWRATAGAKSYEVFVDDTRVGQVAATAGPVLNFALTTALPVGAHHWFVQANPAAGGAVKSNVSAFTVDPPTPWPAWAIGPFQRYGGNPLLRPQGDGWESRNTYNPGVLFDQGHFRMLYRGQGKPVTSRVGYAESPDGVTFTRNPEPLIDATEPFEQKYGCEDARFFKSEGTYYTFYTGSKNGHIAECEATSTDGLHWKKLGVIADGAKNGAVVCDPNGTPVKINGKYAMFIGNAKYGVCYSDDLVTWGPVTWFDMKFPPNWVTPFEPCVAVADHSPGRPDDVVLFIAGTLNGKGRWFYAISEVLFSKADLTKKVDQLDDCIMKPAEPYESGQYKNCLWMNCIIQHNKQWMMYYGAGDRNVGLATAPMN